MIQKVALEISSKIMQWTIKGGECNKIAIILIIICILKTNYLFAIDNSMQIIEIYVY